MRNSRLLYIAVVAMNILSGDVAVSQNEISRDLDPKDYGTKWIYFPDGDGVPRVAILEEGPDDLVEMGRSATAPEVTFQLYTRKNPDKEHILVEGRNKTLASSHFDPSKETKFLVHGWMSSTTSDTIKNMKDAYLNKSDVNVVAVDWSYLASSNFYWFSKTNIPTVGNQLGRLILFLKSNGAKLEDMHLVGHSLGAHVVGAAGRSVKRRGKVARITGLDPALPGFQFYENSEGRLDDTDAHFVQVIHTCSGALGYSSALGHADFYPNGGSPLQPGCCCVPEVVQACSHGRAHQYFTESIITDVGFYALRCGSWGDFTAGKCSGAPVIMGENAPTSAAGIYYLATNPSPPFAMGEPTNNN
ncbi:phospholipase A1 2 [Anabrus simplex]|uniref:phospholipase A1 2 n=1 Tax=Anabrus simplex TaxID=316456 RepID=UPI0035A367D3